MLQSNPLISKGNPGPLGASLTPNGINFAFISKESTQVEILFFLPQETTPFFTAVLSMDLHKTGPVWHACIENILPPFEYTYKTFQNPEWSTELIDPYAIGLSSPIIWNSQKEYAPKSRFFISPPFNWQGIKKPITPFKEWIIYEMHVRGFSKDPSSQVEKAGTFLGLIEKIPYLKSLGINAVELLPIFEFNECENTLRNPITHEKLCNFWGYSPVHFFAPMQRYATSETWEAALCECKEMIRELHRNDIVVILDVVYNHTGEKGLDGSILSFKGLDNNSYYLHDPQGDYSNFSGTGNTLNCNHPTTLQLIIDSLIFWTEEMQVDAFRFDLASILTRGTDGQPLSSPPLLEAMKNEPRLQKTHFIAEAWDAAGLYQVGSFPGGVQWSEWNGQFRDVVRNFIKGSPGLSGAFAKALCGSQDLYWQTSPLKSINFITAHDGYSLYDLVSYQNKYNLANGEYNRDGGNSNCSWNCGTEGSTNNQKIIALRKKQMKNFIVTLVISLGIPMILMGDEYAHTREGNNNPYCQDNKLNWFLWDLLEPNKALFLFFQKAIRFRKALSHLFCRDHFFTDQEITWHGKKPFHSEWNSPNNFIAYSVKDSLQKKDYFICFNAQSDSVFLTLPFLEKGPWRRVVDTSLESPYDFIEDEEECPHYNRAYILNPYSALILCSPASL